MVNIRVELDVHLELIDDVGMKVITVDVTRIGLILTDMALVVDIRSEHIVVDIMMLKVDIDGEFTVDIMLEHGVVDIAVNPNDNLCQTIIERCIIWYTHGMVHIHHL